MTKTLFWVCFATAFAVGAIIGCGESPAKRQAEAQKEAATEALRALKKIQAATQVGVTFFEYGPLVIEAKAIVNQASSVLPLGDLRTELELAMDAYADARAAWDETKYLRSYQEPGRTLIPKYSLKTKNASRPRYHIEHEFISTSDAIRAIWAAADAHLLRAEGAVGSVHHNRSDGASSPKKEAALGQQELSDSTNLTEHDNQVAIAPKGTQTKGSFTVFRKGPLPRALGRGYALVLTVKLPSTTESYPRDDLSVTIHRGGRDVRGVTFGAGQSQAVPEVTDGFAILEIRIYPEPVSGVADIVELRSKLLGEKQTFMIPH